MRVNFLPLLALALLGLGACTAPFSDQQSARVLPGGETELGAHYSSYTFTFEGETESVQSDLGLQLAHGVGSGVDLRLRYGYLSADNPFTADEFNLHALSLGPKFRLSEDAISFYSPFGVAFGEDIDSASSWVWLPTVLLSSEYGQALETTLGLKAVVPFEDASGTLLAANFGLAFGPDIRRFAIRPEFGLMFDPGEEGFFAQFSIGLSFSPTPGP